MLSLYIQCREVACDAKTANSMARCCQCYEDTGFTWHTRICCYSNRMTKHNILTAGEVETTLKNLPDWHQERGKLHAQFTFDTFADAIVFINKVAVIADELDHHPDILNTYNKVSLSLATHDAGDRITDTDVEMARRISQVR